MTSTVHQKQPNPSIQLVKEVADVKGVATTELSPLYETIDSEALDTLLQSDAGSDGGVCRIQFQYEGHTVTVDSDGDIIVAEDDC